MLRRVKRQKRGDGRDIDSIEKAMVHAAKGVSKAQIQRMLHATGQPSSTFKMYDTVRSEGEALVVSETLHKEDGTVEWNLYDPTLLVQHVLQKKTRSSCHLR